MNGTRNRLAAPNAKHVWNVRVYFNMGPAIPAEVFPTELKMAVVMPMTAVLDSLITTLKIPPARDC